MNGRYGSIAKLAVYAYDALRRIGTTTDAVGTTVRSYGDWNLTVADPNGKQKKYLEDAFGSLSQVVEIDGANTATTTYAWNANNKLATTTDALGNIRNFVYNGVGWLIDADDLHAPTDTTFGQWHYAYNANGQFASITDPKGQVINYGYDDQGRVTSEDDAGTASLDVSYSYDTCANGVGRLCTAKTLGQSTNSTTTYAYDPLGRTVEEVRTIGTSVFSTKYDHDPFGNPLFITYPDNAQVKHEYNA